jgi:hypothetical protein
MREERDPPNMVTRRDVLKTCGFTAVAAPLILDGAAKARQSSASGPSLLSGCRSVSFQRVAVETSDNLVDWHPSDAVATPNGSDPDRVFHEVSLPRQQGALFLRLVVFHD